MRMSAAIEIAHSGSGSPVDYTITALNVSPSAQQHFVEIKRLILQFDVAGARWQVVNNTSIAGLPDELTGTFTSSALGFVEVADNDGLLRGHPQSLQSLRVSSASNVSIQGFVVWEVV